MEIIKKGIDGFTIKILALILMTFDHIGEFMPESMNITSMVSLAWQDSSTIIYIYGS